MVHSRISGFMAAIGEYVIYKCGQTGKPVLSSVLTLVKLFKAESRTHHRTALPSFRLISLPLVANVVKKS